MCPLVRGNVLFVTMMIRIRLIR
uniref:Uncharacterized protein n=1 Tax=Rhizophora mucronata TaxID=61149 RepID=A0A2P2NKV8_RHIMU